MVYDHIQFNSLLNMSDWGQIIFNRLDEAYRAWIKDELEIKELLGYQDDKEFNIVNVKNGGIIEYFTSEGKVTFQFNKQLIEEEVIHWYKWSLDWKVFIFHAKEYEDYLNE